MCACVYPCLCLSLSFLNAEAGLDDEMVPSYCGPQVAMLPEETVVHLPGHVPLRAAIAGPLSQHHPTYLLVEVVEALFDGLRLREVQYLT